MNSKNKTKPSKLVSLSLLALLCISVAGNLLLYRHLQNIFSALHAVSLNPLGLDKYRDRDIIAKTSKSRVVFYGDSRAYQWVAPQNSDFQFINRGISGQTTSQILLRFSYDIAPLEPDVIVLQLGANDLRMSLKGTKTRAEIVAECQKNIERIITEAEKINASVILTTVFPLSKDPVPLPYRPFWEKREAIAASINEVNQYLLTLQNRAIVLDAYNLLKKQDPNGEKYYRDLLHLNGDGYQLLNQKLEKILRQIVTK